MKSILIVLAFLLTSDSYSQNYWIPTGTMSTGNNDFVYSITSSPEGELYASSWAVGVYKSSNGTNWNFSGLSGKRVSYLTVAPNGDVYGLSITQSFSYIHRSTDRGATWEDVYTGSFPLNYAGGGSIVFPSDGSIVAAFAVTVGPSIGDVSTFVFKSTNNGSNWVQTQRIDLGFVGGMVIAADGKILLGTSLGGVAYSTNNGNTFLGLSSFPSIFIKTIVKAPDNTIYVSDAFGLNRSTDNGNTFENAGGQNSTAFLRSAGVNSDGDLFISMDDKKVFRSKDRGGSWTQVNNGLPATVYPYSFTTMHGIMYAGTNNLGAFYFVSPTGINSQTEVADDFRLYQNFPNPFNPKTVINYELKVSGHVDLKIYDSAGNEVATLLSGEENAGLHSVIFNGSDLASGIYYYRMNANGESGTRSMILLK
ncbi:MAG: T9SS type A sorting domain-containing protein [Ignavibacteria bacterium]